MLYQNHNRVFIESFIGARKYYALRNYLSVTERNGNIEVAVTYGSTERLFDIPMDEYNRSIRYLSRTIANAGAKAHHFAMYFYLKENGLLPKVKAKFIEQGIPADHSYVRELV